MPSATSQLLPVTRLSANIATDVGTEQVSTLAKLLNEYGTEVVIIAVFIFLFGIFAFAFLRILNKLVETIIKQNQTLVDKISGTSDKKEEKKESKSKDKEETPKKEDTQTSEPKLGLVANNVYINKIFSEVAKKVSADLHADRVAIYVFHNGNKTPFGYSFVKMTCIYEETLKGTSTARATAHQGVPLHVFTNIIDCLLRNGEYIVGNVYNHGIISADEQILNFISGSRTKALFAIAVKDTAGEVAGFIIAEFDNEQDFSNTARYNEARTSLKRMSDTIQPIIANDEFRAHYEKEAH